MATEGPPTHSLETSLQSVDKNLHPTKKKRTRNLTNKLEMNWTMAMRRHWNTPLKDKAMSMTTIKRSDMHMVCPQHQTHIPRSTLTPNETWQCNTYQCDLLVFSRRITDCILMVWSSLMIFLRMGQRKQTGQKRTILNPCSNAHKVKLTGYVRVELAAMLYMTPSSDHQHP